MRALGREIAARSDRLAADRRHQARAPATRRESGAVAAERRHDEPQPELLADRRELRAQPGFGDLACRLAWSAWTSNARRGAQLACSGSCASAGTARLPETSCAARRCAAVSE
jgi:hypothetical protein